MNFANELAYHITGGNSVAFCVAAFFFVLLGALINVLYDVQTRGREDKDDEWDWRFFWFDNRWRIILNFVMALIVVRFFTDITDRPLTMGYCFLIGIVFDAMYVVYKKLRRRVLRMFD